MIFSVFTVCFLVQSWISQLAPYAWFEPATAHDWMVRQKATERVHVWAWLSRLLWMWKWAARGVWNYLLPFHFPSSFCFYCSIFHSYILHPSFFALPTAIVSFSLSHPFYPSSLKMSPFFFFWHSLFFASIIHHFPHPWIGYSFKSILLSSRTTPHDIVCYQDFLWISWCTLEWQLRWGIIYYLDIALTSLTRWPEAVQAELCGGVESLQEGKYQCFYPWKRMWKSKRLSTLLQF